METKEIFAKRLLEIREEQGLTRQKVADDLGITRASLEYYEKGKRTPDINTIAKIAKYYNTTTDYLFGLSYAKTVNTDLKAVCDYIGLSEKAVIRLKDGIVNDSPVLIPMSVYSLIKEVQNNILSKNVVFRISDCIVNCKESYECALSFAEKLDKDNLPTESELKQLDYYERMIKGEMFNLLKYISDVVQSECKQEIERLKLLKIKRNNSKEDNNNGND